MKATDQFKAAIKTCLDERAKADELFAATYAKQGKSLDDCVNYILQQVQKQGYAGYTDDEIYRMAVHYYDEDDLKDIKPVECRVVVNHVVELSEEDKAEANKRAMEEYQIKCVREEEAAARKRAKEELERQRQEAAADEAAFAEAKKRFMGLLITDGDLLIRPLRSVAEFADEGEAMHHCVFSNRYYRKENSLILTARAADKTRIETIEVDLQSYRIVQSRGVNNKETAEHERIVTLVTSNINKIKKLAKNESKKTKSASGCRC